VNFQSRLATRRTRTFWKGVLFRGLAILLGLSPLLISEVALWALGLGRPTDHGDPFVGFSDIHPLFVENALAGKYEIPPSRRSHFQPESFLANKPSDEFRIFVLGGSTVQGRPWGVETSFTTWLELSLQAADPSRRYEVVNCGGVSYATYRLVPILQEVLAHDPDMIIFCEGHNEFLEDRTYAKIKSAPAVIAWPQQQISRLRTCTLLRDGYQKWSGSQPAALCQARPVLGPEVDARLDWKGGMAQYHRDPTWQAEVIDHFDLNLNRIVQITREAGIPLVLVNPVSNLQWPPFKSEHRAGLEDSERRRFAALLELAKSSYASDLPGALSLLRQAAQIDDQHALVHYEIGRCCRELLRSGEAREALLAAKELDICPLRMLEPMRARMKETAKQSQTPLLDAHELIAAHSRSGYPDHQWMVDHVHPSLEGHQLIAESLLIKMVEMRVVVPAVGWKESRDRAYRNHLTGLTHAYFVRGKQRLDAEQGWAHGLVERERSVDQSTAPSNYTGTTTRTSASQR
jgi:hypothetical protein